MNKAGLKDVMLNLTVAELDAAREHYQQFLEEARLDRSETFQIDDQSHAESAAELAEAFEHAAHDAEEKLAHLRSVDFGPKEEVEEGALVKLGGRWFVFAASTGRFSYEGEEVMGVSCAAPIYQALEGKGAGDTATVQGRSTKIETVF